MKPNLTSTHRPPEKGSIMQKIHLLSAFGTALLLAATAAHAVSLVGLTTDNRLTSFDSSNPSALSPFLTISGVTPGARIVGIDTRPSDNMIYGVGTDNKVYRIDPTSGVATLHSTLTGASIDPNLKYGMDFNPVADAAGTASLRLVSSSGSNFAINANTGAVGNAAATIQSNFGEVAYTNSNPAGTMAPASTKLYYIDFVSDQLYVANSAFNTPTINLVGSLGIDTIGAFGFDILADGSAYASLTSAITGQGGLYSINLTSGAATLLGGFGVSSPLLAGLTAAPVPEPGHYAMMLSGLGLVGFAVRRRQLQAA
jgi:hypothetical protein